MAGSFSYFMICHSKRCHRPYTSSRYVKISEVEQYTGCYRYWDVLALLQQQGRGKSKMVRWV